MTGRIVFLLEGLLPRVFPDLSFLCVAHEGKQDLDKSVPRKLRAWREPGVRFLVLRDNDGADCHRVKARLQGLCRKGGREDTVVRIVCQELEAWYLGDADALAEAFGREALRRISGRSRFRDPDSVRQPSAAVRRLIPEFQKTSGARRMARFLSREGNRSTSFRCFMQGIERLRAAPVNPTVEDRPCPDSSSP